MNRTTKIFVWLVYGSVPKCWDPLGEGGCADSSESEGSNLYRGKMHEVGQFILREG